MNDHDIVAVRQWQGCVELCCNCFLDGFEKLRYWPVNDAENVTELILESDNVIIRGLDELSYTFCCYDEDETPGGELEMRITDSKDDEEILVESYIELGTVEEKADREILECLIEDIVSDLNNRNQYMNRSDGLDIRLDKENILRFSCNDSDFLGECNVEIFSYDKGWRYIERKILAAGAEFSLSEGLYKLKLYDDDYLVRQFYIKADSEEERDRKYEKLVKRAEELEKNKLTSISLLPSDYVLESDKEKEVLAALSSANEEKKLFPAPNITYLDGIIEAELGEIYGFIKKLPDRKFYLSFVTHDEIYLKESIPIKVDIEAETFMFNADEYFFRPTDYYYYVEDDMTEKISAAGHIDLSEIIYSDEDNDEADYNSSYNLLLWNQYIKNLHSVFLEGKAKLWPDVKLILDRYPDSYEIGEKAVNNWFLENIVKNYAGGRESFAWILFYYYLCEFKYYRNIDRRFMKSQIAKPRYRTHIIPEGKFVLVKTLISLKNKSIITEYLYSEEPVEFDVDDADFTVFYCIGPDNDYKTSDFGLYIYLGGNSFSYKFNSLEVDIRNGL